MARLTSAAEAARRLHWEQLLLDAEKSVTDTLQQRLAVLVCLQITARLIRSYPPSLFLQPARYVPLLRGFIHHDRAISRLMHVPTLNG